MGMNCKSSCGMKCGKFFILAVVGIAALGWVVMALWNWLAPSLIAGGREINYLQAMGLLVLSKILFGGLRCHGGWHGRWHQSRLEKMTPEEREKFQTGMSGCCGGKQKDDAAETRE
jgi:hypothetical protein